MDQRYQAYCLTDRVFYDSPATPADVDGAFPAATGPVPDGWDRSDLNIWVVLRPYDARMVDQGWKIHVSAGMANAEQILGVVWDYCTTRRLPFKFLRGRPALLAQNSKYADRTGSGKFITIYPCDVDSFEATLRELDDLLTGQPGPYILSDLRWRSGPLYVRYGGFRERLCRSEDGGTVPAIEDPDGNLVPDVRRPTFYTPPWVTIPEFLAESIAARGGDAGGEAFPYQVEKALHFSNGGGVYLGKVPDSGQQVLIKEARPLAGLDRSGADAVTRLERERAVLERLAGLDCVPRVLDHRTWWEHHFLVRNYVEGETLSRHVIAQHPLLRPDATDEKLRAYTTWALDIVEQIRRGIEAIHDRGIVFGDLHPNNVIVRPDDSIAFVDFEVAAPVEAPRQPTLGAPGYIAPPSFTGFDVDRFAVGCLRLAMFMWLAPVISWDDTKADQFIRIVAERFPVPADFAEQVRRERRPSSKNAAAQGAAGRRRVPRDSVWPDSGLPDWESIRASMTTAMLASATPERADRLFPGDIEQFTPGGGIGFAYGAAGVLWALAESGQPTDPDHEKWLIDAVDRLRRPLPGFYDGLCGVAFTLDRLGCGAEARAVLERAMSVPGERDPSLFRGLAGIGLTLVHFARRTGDRALLDAAARLAERVVSSLSAEPVPAPQAGLMFGAAGPALFLVRLYEATGEEALLDHAATFLRRDLDGCMWTEDRTLQVDEGWRVLPYVATGSAGIGLVLHEFLRHRDDDSFAEAAQGVRRAAEPEFIVQAGLFNGRSGLISYLLHTRTHAEDARQPIERHLRNLGWHAVSYQGGTAFIGDQLMRLSMDLATGSAGILLTLGAALTRRGASLPFLNGEREVPGFGHRKEVSGYGDRS